MRYRVYFTRTTSLELYLDVEAESEAQAKRLAETATEEDDQLIDLPETFSSTCEPSGEIEAIEGEEEP